MKHDIETIRKLNDNLRKAGIGGDFLVTCGVSDLPFPDHIAVVRLTTEFDAFTPDNDPDGEHNFGSFEYGGNKFFWKIDYYDKQKIFGSPNPADTAVTHRVLTLMIAQEY